MQDRIETVNGMLACLQETSGVRVFKGIPFAQPPLGQWRWTPPQPPINWPGIRQAGKFGPRAMQRPVFGDMCFRSEEMSEDCLYLNIWTPAASDNERLPVLVYFHGGGFVAGDGSETRYDGESMARQGIVAITVNYRLGIFGFFAHPELSQESSYHASGNYGLLDQHAALLWVRQNIAAFGGDPARITIAGESAGSIAVSAHMVSPLSKGLIAGAIGESGSIIATLPAIPLFEAERRGIAFAASLDSSGSPSLASLRAMSASQLLEATARLAIPWFRSTIDNCFFPKDPAEVYAAGEQAPVPLLAGSNTEEMTHAAVLGGDPPTVENYRQALQRLYAEKADQVFEHYPASTTSEVLDAAQALASDRFISFSTWKWIDTAVKSGGWPAYYYLYAHPRPALRPQRSNVSAPAKLRAPWRGAVHSAEIEYAMGNLDRNPLYAWTPDDYEVSGVMQSYFANFIKSGNPNGPGLAVWPEYHGRQRMIIDVDTRAENHMLRSRYEFLSQFY